MTNAIHIMLDLETWGTKPGSDIRSIGACVFNPTTGAVNPNDGDVHPSHFYTACNNRLITYPDIGYMNSLEEWRLYNLDRDPQTAQWWHDQSDEAKAAFADSIDLREALVRFGDWIAAVRSSFVNEDRIYAFGTRTPSPDDIRLWSHGAHFDGPILAAAYEAVGLPVPWHYRALRDTRTAFDMAGIDDHSAWLARHPGPLGMMHHALDDAMCQARAVCAAYRLVKRWRNTSYADDALPSRMHNIIAGIEDEGDRVYFGSTNDADDLRQISEDLEADRFERDAFSDES